MAATVETLTIADARLPAAVKAAAAIMPGARCPKPVLRNVKLTATVDGFAVHGTDLETSIVVTVGERDAAPIGETLVPSHIAASIGKAKAAVAVTMHGETLEAFGATVPVDDPAEYPAAPAIDGPFAAFLPMQFVRLVENHVSVATDGESSRYALGGVLFERNGDRLHAVGTDGRRLHVVTTAIETDRPELAAIVPPYAITAFRKAVDALAGAIAGKGGKAARAVADGYHVGVRTAGNLVELSWACGDVAVRVVSRTIEGRFPRWRDVIQPCHFETAATYCPMPATLEQVKAAARVTSESSKGVMLRCGVVKAQSATGGTYEAPFVGTAAAEVTTLLDPRYWTAALEGAAAVSCEAVPMHWGDPQSAVYFRGADGLTPRDGQIGFAAIVMPLAAD